MFKPEYINILGKDYKVIYCDSASDVDTDGRQMLWGQVDYWTRTIRIYDNKCLNGDVLHRILHEILHAIVSQLNIDSITNSSTEEDDIDMISLALADVLIRNGWLKLDI